APVGAARQPDGAAGEPEAVIDQGHRTPNLHRDYRVQARPPGPEMVPDLKPKPGNRTRTRGATGVHFPHPPGFGRLARSADRGDEDDAAGALEAGGDPRKH